MNNDKPVNRFVTSDKLASMPAKDVLTEKELNLPLVELANLLNPEIERAKRLGIRMANFQILALTQLKRSMSNIIHAN